VIGGKLAHQYHSTRKRKAPYKLASVWGLNVFFASKTIRCKGKRDERLHVISNRFSGSDMLELYKQRWGIELLFSHLKKRGFHLEDTHMTSANKIEKLFALISLAFLFSYAWGCELRSLRKETSSMKRKSHFRLGFEDILRILNNSHPKQEELTAFIRWLKQPCWSNIFIV